jgi:predicted nucleotidyltransferase
MIDLTPKQLDILRDLLASRVPDREVRAFGSRVSGQARRLSDLDLVVMGEEPVPELVLANLRADLEDSDLPFRVDLLELRDLPATWIERFREQSAQVYPA